jgi:hypothetical protein
MSAFSILQSTVHSNWAAENSSRQGPSIRYSVTKAFETFPFPLSWKEVINLDTIGNQYYIARESVIANRKIGLTSLYNIFHAPNINDPDIVELRALHSKMDRAVLDCYGWKDIILSSEFFLNSQNFSDNEGNSDIEKSSFRFGWSDEVRDEVLARLLELNAARALDESRAKMTNSYATFQGATKGSVSNRPQSRDLFS